MFMNYIGGIAVTVLLRPGRFGVTLLRQCFSCGNIYKTKLLKPWHSQQIAAVVYIFASFITYEQAKTIKQKKNKE